MAELIRLQGTGGPLWRGAGVKFFMDGTVDNGTAWLETPDCHGESAHAHWPDPQRYTGVIAALHRAGVPTATHAIGDAAVRHGLDSVEQAQAGGPGAGHPVRHRGRTRRDRPGRHRTAVRARLGAERAGRAFRCRDPWEAGPGRPRLRLAHCAVPAAEGDGGHPAPPATSRSWPTIR
ncbi:amidohydrolase family protein [Streptomyces sp. NPDC001852]|uniref:amidohydrolase family protein n=1 Tax=Streptomyces sp. NPDC001852 TaxID=3364619 RepID=UPI0036CF7FBC